MSCYVITLISNAIFFLFCFFIFFKVQYVVFSSSSRFVQKFLSPFFNIVFYRFVFLSTSSCMFYRSCSRDFKCWYHMTSFARKMRNKWRQIRSIEYKHQVTITTTFAKRTINTNETI